MITATELGRQHALSGGWLSTGQRSPNRPAPLLRRAGVAATAEAVADFRSGFNAALRERSEARQQEVAEAAQLLRNRAHHGKTVYSADCDQFGNHATGYYDTAEDAEQAFWDENTFSDRERAGVIVYTREEAVADSTICDALHGATCGSPSPALQIFDVDELADALGVDVDAVCDVLATSNG